MASPTELTAFVVALVALVISLLQVMQQYIASVGLRSKVGRAAIGTWASKNKLRVNFREFKLRRKYLEPVFTWEGVESCLTEFKKRDSRLLRPFQGKYNVAASHSIVIDRQGRKYRRSPRLVLTRIGIGASEMGKPAVPLGYHSFCSRHSDLIAAAVALDMEMRHYDLHKPAIHMTAPYCSIRSHDESGVGILARYTSKPHHVHDMQSCSPPEIHALVNIAQGYQFIGDVCAHMTDWGYNSVDIHLVNSDWFEMTTKGRFHCEGDKDAQWNGHWTDPATTRVGFLLSHCGNPAIANSFPHSLLREWRHSDGRLSVQRANDFVNQTIGFIESPIQAALASRTNCARSDQVPILPEIRRLLDSGDFGVDWGRTFNTKRFDRDDRGWKANGNTVCWLQIMLFDSWIARRVDQMILGPTATVDSAVPVDMNTANICAISAVTGGDSSRGRTTGWKRSRAQFIRYYLARLADGITPAQGGLRIGVSCMSRGGRIGAAGWQGMPVGAASDWAVLDAVLSLRAMVTVMATRMELLKNTDVFLELHEFDPMIRMA
ncbi:hypothetical protein DFH06DRAFT_1438726 [Mycena polygramma]|nr:hypothetical protein DFH06DRAFT_1438726 [Mycena polygramma]